MENKTILAIDPGDVESAYVFWDGKVIIDKGKIKNEDLLHLINKCRVEKVEVVIEMIASYGMPVGANIFETCVWIGRFIQECTINELKYDRAFRIQIKNHICHSSKANDSNVIQALVDRFGNTNIFGKYGKGTKKNPGFFYEFSKDIWQAFAVAVYSYDNLNKQYEN